MLGRAVPQHSFSARLAVGVGVPWPFAAQCRVALAEHQQAC
jgi:hypothetical protein